MSLIALADQSNKFNTRYEQHITKTKMSHLLHMDDLKLTRKTEEELKKQMQLELSVMKPHGLWTWQVCKNCIKEGKLVHLENVILDMNREIQEVEQGETCK